VEETTKRLSEMKILLYGDGEQEAKPEKCAQLAELLIASGLVPKLITGLDQLPFEARKQFAQVYNNLMRRDLVGFVSYVERKPEILSALVAGYENPEVALCGTMLREVGRGRRTMLGVSGADCAAFVWLRARQSIRHEILAGKILYSADLWKFFDVYVHLPNFEVGSDAFATFKDLFTRHKTLAATFFTSNFDVVFAKYNCLLMSENYVTRRQSLKLLGEILLDRSNFDIMMKYIGYAGTRPQPDASQGADVALVLVRAERRKTSR
jgi:calcium binding protein 39